MIQTVLWRARVRTPPRASPRRAETSGLLRAEVFSGEQLQRHARALAGLHRIEQRHAPNRLLPRLADNEQVLLQTHDLLIAAEAEGWRMAPAGEWLLDNFYLIEQQIRMARRHLPRTYNRQLPRLAAGPSAGFPRVYDIALELIAHSDGRLDAQRLALFVKSYQSVAPLTLGELWAVPIMLRLALIENMRRVAEDIAWRRRQRNAAGLWADRLVAAAERGQTEVLQDLAAMARADPPFSNPFVEEFARRIQGQGDSLAIVQSWVDHRLASDGLGREELQHADSHAQAASEVSMGNSIGSLRFLSDMDWREFVETMSQVERTLRADPAGVYGATDFATRDRCRHRIEALARRTGRPETDVAASVLGLATAVRDRDGAQAPAAHVGFYLIDRGHDRLEIALGMRRSVRRVAARILRRCALGLYVGAGAVLAVGILAALTPFVDPTGWQYWVLAVPGLLVASGAALAVVNRATAILVPPRTLPRMDFSRGIPSDHRTMVVVPTLLSGQKAVAELLESLEVRFLGNRDPNLWFALLTDFDDAPVRVQEGDEDLLEAARRGIVALNEKYASEGRTVFALFHRPRVWNPYERAWMGYERKRGKLEQFNALLRGGAPEAFSTIVADLTILRSIKYVITLDRDTSLPRGAAHELVGTMAHPLNRPVFDPRRGRVVEGYAILQPRVPISLSSAARSLFSRLSAGETGIDPYTHEVSDVYQDVFAEGSYVGKGIYDVDAFQQATAGRFPENLILSHDLVESGYARSAAVSDVELYEDHPASFLAEMSRRHRWIRGDWQVGAWLRPRVPGPNRTRRSNPLSALARWKILDNLRRSLVPPAFLALFVFAWLGGPLLTRVVSLFLLAMLVGPVLASVLPDALRRPEEAPWALHLRARVRSMDRQLWRAALDLVTLPYQAVISAGAILASRGRMVFTRRGLLMWHTRRYATRSAAATPAEFFREMWAAPLCAVAGFAVLIAGNPSGLAWGAPVLLAWFIAPFVAWRLSRPLVSRIPDLGPTQRTFLRSLARRTWRYFEALVSEQDNWLPPDNYQEDPGPMVAPRTSPTNIALALLSDLAGYDFGYLAAGELMRRTERTIATLERMERFRGHFYNWYDTRTLRPLPPMYVSSVDSGNLLGALCILRTGLSEASRRPVDPERLLAGLADTLRELRKEAGTDSPLEQSAQRAQSVLDGPPASEPAAAADRLEALCAEAAEMSRSVADASDDLRAWAAAFGQQCRGAREEVTIPPGGEDARERNGRIEALAARCTALMEMDFSFLYDSACDLLSIGYDVANHRLDPSRYDRLASEGRLGSFVLIARNRLPQKHWFALGRQITSHNGAPALLSWGGTMFEYLMPLLIMPTYAQTLLDETYHAVVARQIQYGHERGVPWGVSESCYNATDAGGAYQYRAFGVPGLGLRRGLSDDLVVAPYASAMALMVEPAAACRNLQRLEAEGYQGRFGLFEAIDFTPSRVPRGRSDAPVCSFMAHHQGMTLLALDYLLNDRPMQRRFREEPAFRATELLLQERVPTAAPTLQPHEAEVNAARKLPARPATSMRIFSSPHTPIPEIHLLSNGRYHVMATSAGGGYSRWNTLAVTRWREDATCDSYGLFCYLRELPGGALWSTAYQPTRVLPKKIEAIFVEGRAEYRRRDREIDAHTEIAVSPEDDVEVRRVTLTNLSARARTIELTSYAEAVIAPLAADLAHPVFSNLFVQTEILPERNAILVTRRPRAPDEHPPWLFHLLTAQGALATGASYETDRARFIGRGRTTEHPAAFDSDAPLSNTDGAVLDPIVAIRQAVAIQSFTPANFHVITGMADTREAALALIGRYRDPSFAARALEMAWSHSQVVLRQLDATETEAQVYEQLAASVVHANPLHRAGAAVLSRNRRGQSDLWSFGISGDLPIVLLRIGHANRIDLVEQALKAHAYWRLKGLEADLVILNEDFSGYRQALNDRIMGAVAGGPSAPRLDKPGGVFVRRREQLSEEDLVLLQTVARAIIADEGGTLAEQVQRQLPAERSLPRLARPRALTGEADPPPPAVDRQFSNGLGGFTPDGREYVVTLGPEQTTPLPWTNVIANAQMGTVVSESGSSYTWAENAHEFRLTPWHNDPVTDSSGEAVYVRDEHSGRFWSPSPLPARGPGTYVCRHGFGYSVFEHAQSEIQTELAIYVARDAAVKLMMAKVRNLASRSRRVSVTAYCALVLGQWREQNLMHVVTEIDAGSGALFARNAYNREFAGRVVFLNCSETERTVTGSRAEFIGRNGTLADPAGLHRTGLSGRTGASLDPCAAMQVPLEIPGGEERDVVFVLGAGRNANEARDLLQRFGGTAAARQAREQVEEYWRKTLGTVSLETPDRALDILVNGWLEYQALACRYWGRSGFYQSGGAYGFRDQLQDTTAVIQAAPEVAREHLVRSASRQFREGDVQHWWHPPSGRGVRTRIADDFLWLPYAVCRYVTVTGDAAVLDEAIPFLKGRPVNPDEESYYDLPERAEERGTLYEHCVRAINHALSVGAHGLPLMGCGDWNDGMNRVGLHGRGESVWLAFFLFHVLDSFAAVARSRGDAEFAGRCREEMEQLRRSIEEHAWDGDWYRRAFFDDGTPLGSRSNEECQIDSLAQSWAVLSTAADPARAHAAMDSVRQRLVRPDGGLILLFDPPFDSSALQPGYIRGYVPGVRENGGHYTHAAVWVVMAFAEIGETELAWELLSSLNPIRRAETAEAARLYKVEPYVMAADIYAQRPHAGRGGWTWYTGSAGWMYRLVVETLMGLAREGDLLRLNPRPPRGWVTFMIHYRFAATPDHITVRRAGSGADHVRVLVDGVRQSAAAIRLVDDGRDHDVQVLM